MKNHVTAFAGGSLFAVGLAVSGMTKPSKVTGFLDVAGKWDGSLGLVMFAALVVSFIAHRFIRQRSAPVFDVKFHLPTRKDIDWRLMVGASVFGVGWGLGGLCPGPGLVAAAGGVLGAIVFVIGMTGGMLLEHAVARRIAHASRHRRLATDVSFEAGTRGSERDVTSAQPEFDLHHLEKQLGEQP